MMLFSAIINALIAFQLGVGGIRLGQGQVFLLLAGVSAVLAVVMFVRWDRDRRSRRTR
jgi:glutamate mutase epsilon subunit